MKTIMEIQNIKMYKNAFLAIFKHLDQAEIRIMSRLNKFLNKLVVNTYPDIYDENMGTLILKNDNLELFKNCKGYDNDEICKHAIKYGAINILKYAHENGCSLGKHSANIAIVYAAKYGNLECMKYVHKTVNNWGHNIYKNVCEITAKYGNLECLIYAHENNCPWYAKTCSVAAEHGNLDCLIYAHKNNCPWDENTCSGAAKNGHLDCLIYACENDCPWDKSLSLIHI